MRETHNFYVAGSFRFKSETSPNFNLFETYFYFFSRCAFKNSRAAFCRVLARVSEAQLRLCVQIIGQNDQNLKFKTGISQIGLTLDRKDEDKTGLEFQQN